MHGTMYDGPVKKSKAIWVSKEKPRKDHDASDWLTATEFEDQPSVLAAKVAQLAKLMRLSKHTVVYSGAGISASAVGQAALSGQNKVGWTGQGTAAQPTPTHRALGVFGRSGWVHGWVQQNHDGLPQKAGFPQENICEVHGSWFDPANPVVKYSGCLKSHECEWMEAETERADLVLVMGTSLGGLNADQVATECAKRASTGVSLGACIINLQQTMQDDKMSLNLFGKSDDVMRLLLEQLGLPALDPKAPAVVAWPDVSCALVPYDAKGVRLPAGSTKPRMWLDLRPGARVKLSASHNHQGARQPNTLHIGAKKGSKGPKADGKDEGKRVAGPGNGAVVGRDEATCSFKLSIESAPMKLGIWWLEAASRGGPAMLPVINQKPLFEDSEESTQLEALREASRGDTVIAKPASKPTAARKATPAGERVLRW